MDSEWNDWTGDEPPVDDGDTADLAGYDLPDTDLPDTDLPDAEYGGDGPGEHDHGGFDADLPGRDLDTDLSLGDDLADPLGTDADPADELAGGPDPSTGDGDVPAEEPLPAAELDREQLVGADPDLPAEGGGDWGPQFPPSLELEHVPDPVDGYPWSDPGALGGGDPDAARAGWDAAAGWSAPAPAELADYAGAEVPSGGDPWAALLGSDDPATSSLARWWAPGG
jgi:hypothetical protein